MEILDNAVRFIEERSREPVVWGVSDCSAWAAAWVEHLTGHRMQLPKWASHDEAHDLIASYGSLSSLWSEVIDEDDYCPLQDGHGEPSVGDVGIIMTHLCGEVGGIFLNHRNFVWRVDQGGYRLIRPRMRSIVKFWRPICEH
jgi:hypothetical protein